MSTVIAVWPDNTVSVVRMWRGFTALDLFNELDAESNPIDARCYLVTGCKDGLHITFNFRCSESHAGNRRLRIGKVAGRIKRLQWPKNIQADWLKSL